MESNAIYTTSDAGLNRFFGKIYGLVGMGVGLSAVISYLMLGPFSHLFCRHCQCLIRNRHSSLHSKLRKATTFYHQCWS